MDVLRKEQIHSPNTGFLFVGEDCERTSRLE